jgi:spore coat polysaccharide biosynthesis protein SpsF
MTGIVVLCRYNSSRLFGKILKKINEKEILLYILERLQTLKERYPIIVCTSLEDTDNPIAEFCEKHNINIFRGSLDNVSDRFLNCALENNLKYAVRVNGDNLFVDSKLIQDMILTTENEKMKFVSNVKDRTFPKGMSVEIVDVKFYKKHISKFEKEDIEHVMTYFYRLNQKNIKYIYNEKAKFPEEINLAIDTQKDFDNAKKIIDLMQLNHTEYDYKEIIKVYNRL